MVCHGPNSLGNILQLHPDRTTYRNALITSLSSVCLGLPCVAYPGKRGRSISHSLSVKSLGYRLVAFAILRCRVQLCFFHMPDYRTEAKSFQTLSKVRIVTAIRIRIKPAHLEKRVICLSEIFLSISPRFGVVTKYIFSWTKSKVRQAY